MTTLRFRFDPNKPDMTMGDFATIELMQDGQIKIYRLQKLAARFMVSEGGDYLPFARAMAILDELPRDEMQDAIVKFGEAVRDAAVNPTTGGNSQPPSPADTPASPSLDGSQP